MQHKPKVSCDFVKEVSLPKLGQYLSSRNTEWSEAAGYGIFDRVGSTKSSRLI